MLCNIMKRIFSAFSKPKEKDQMLPQDGFGTAFFHAHCETEEEKVQLSMESLPFDQFLDIYNDIRNQHNTLDLSTHDCWSIKNADRARLPRICGTCGNFYTWKTGRRCHNERKDGTAFVDKTIFTTQYLFSQPTVTPNMIYRLSKGMDCDELAHIDVPFIHLANQQFTIKLFATFFMTWSIYVFGMASDEAAAAETIHDAMIALLDEWVDLVDRLDYITDVNVTLDGVTAPRLTATTEFLAQVAEWFAKLHVPIAMAYYDVREAGVKRKNKTSKTDIELGPELVKRMLSPGRIGLLHKLIREAATLRALYVETTVNDDGTFPEKKPAKRLLDRLLPPGKVRENKKTPEFVRQSLARAADAYAPWVFAKEK